MTLISIDGSMPLYRPEEDHERAIEAVVADAQERGHEYVTADLCEVIDDE